MKVLGFGWDPYNVYQDEERAEYTVSGQHIYVNDVLFRPLGKVSREWKLTSCREDMQDGLTATALKRPSVLLWPGEPLADDASEHTAVVAQKEEFDPRSARLIRTAFVAGKSNKWKIPIVDWKEISQLLKVLIASRDDYGVQSILKAFRTIAEDYLRTREQIGVPHTRASLDERIMSPYRPPTLMDLDFHEVVTAAIRNEAFDCLNEIGDFLYMMARSAFEINNVDYFDEVLRFFPSIYELSLQTSHEPVRRQARGLVLRRFVNISEMLDGYLWNHEMEEGRYVSILPFVQTYLVSIRETMKDATAVADGQTFRKLLECSNDILKHHVREGNLGLSLSHSGEPTVLEGKLAISDAKVLSNLVVAAWLYRKSNEGTYERDSTKPLILDAIQLVLQLPELLEVYLLGRSREPWELRYADWDMVPGQVQHGNAFDRWIEPFWIIIALRRFVKRPKVFLERIRSLSGITQFDCKHLSDSITRILEEHAYDWLIDDVDLEQGKNPLLDVFYALAGRQARDRSRQLIETQIPPENIQKLADQCERTYNEKRALGAFLAFFQNSATRHSVTACALPLQPYLARIEKECLLQADRIDSRARIYGERIADVETFCYARAIETSVPVTRQIPSFEKLPDLIREEASRLRNRRFTPSVVLLPEDHRYESRLTNVPYWNRVSPIEANPFLRWVATFDGMQVFSWPYPKAESVFVGDIGNLVRLTLLTEANGKPLTVEMRHFNRSELDAWLSAQLKADKREFRRVLRLYDYSREKLAETVRVVSIQNRSVLEFTELAAAVRMSPRTETMGLVYHPPETTYHRLSCKLVRYIPHEEREYFATIGTAQANEAYAPCDQCHPGFEDPWL